MKSWILSLLLLSMPLAGASAAPIGPPPRETKWVVDFGDFRCTLYRQIAGSPVTLALTWLPGNREIGLRWINLAWDARSSPKAPELFLQPGHTRIEGLSFAPLEAGQGIGSEGLPYAFLDRLAAATAIRLEDGGRLVQEIALPKAPGAVRVLRRCQETALRDFGIDPVAYAALRKIPNPIGGPEAWFTAGDYPRWALAANVSGEVISRTTIGPDGRVKDCVTVGSSGNEQLDRETCALVIQRGRFEPALGPSGAPVAAPWLIRTNWRIP